MGEGVDQKAGWTEMLKETCNAAAGELLATSGTKCQVEKFEEVSGQSQVTRAFQLRSGDRAWTVLVRQDLRAGRGRLVPCLRNQPQPRPVRRRQS